MTKKRAREAGVPFDGTPGKYNAITDVKGVEVGYSTAIYGEVHENGELDDGFIRSGVTAILPKGKKKSAVFAGRHDLNGNGELTGTHWIDDSGFLHGPIMITNTNSVGIVRDTTSKWMIENNFYYPLVFEGNEIPGCGYFYPAVGETWDGLLNDINSFGIKADHVIEAIESAKSGAIEEGNIGGGTGMVCHDFKGGTGTASRLLPEEDGGYTVGVLVQANHGYRDKFKIKGIPAGKMIKGCEAEFNSLRPKPGTGSIIVVIATDAPVLPWQLSKMCKRIPIGIGALGSYGENGSGDIFIAFSTANEGAYTNDISQIELISDDRLDSIYTAVAQAVEEAILNAMFAAETMKGYRGNKVYALPQEQVMKILKKNQI